ncbi:redox-active disulfide protein 2 [Spirosoma pomorum]|jgi:uncharacterized membrane protein YhhN
MKPKTLQEQSTEALLKRKKTTKFVTGMLAGMLAALVIMAILLANKKGISLALPFFIIPLGLLPIVFICLNDVKATQKELLTRNVVQ